MSDSSTNFDPSEVNKFAAQASRWWDPESQMKPLHRINPLRLGFINERTPLAGLAVLDVGCGGGILSESMAQIGAHVTGIDLGEAPLQVARMHARETGVEVDYRRITAEELAAQQPGHWDIVTCMELLEHVPDPSSVVAACSRLTKPSGHVYFSTINRNPKSFLMAIAGAEYLLNLLPRGTHQYARLIKPSELNGWAEAAQLETRELTGLHYNPFSRIYHLGPGVDVNYILHTKKTS